MCSGEQWGGAAEILSRNGVEHGEHTHLHILGLSVENAGQSERATVINMQLNAYLSMQPFWTGDA